MTAREQDYRRTLWLTQRARVAHSVQVHVPREGKGHERRQEPKARY